MLQVPELRRARGFDKKYCLEKGNRKDRIKLLGNGVCPQVMEAAVRTLVVPKQFSRINKIIRISDKPHMRVCSNISNILQRGNISASLNAGIIKKVQEDLELVKNKVKTVRMSIDEIISMIDKIGEIHKFPKENIGT
jgi:hypothetical protein